jgi:tRNA 2-thiouridine synthesizing protein A
MDLDHRDKDVAGAELVDARGHRCPMPLLMAKRALNRLDDGQLLQVLATDAGSARDFSVFARQSGHELLETEQRDDTFHILLRKHGNA